MTTRTLEISSPPDDVGAVHGLLETVWSESPTVSDGDRIRFETALVELAGNVIRHADGGAGVTCVLTVEVTDAAISACLVDSGRPGDVDLERTMPDPLEESGRGIALIQALVDRLEYTRHDNLNRWEIERARVPA